MSQDTFTTHVLGNLGPEDSVISDRYGEVRITKAICNPEGELKGFRGRPVRGEGLQQLAIDTGETGSTFYFPASAIKILPRKDGPDRFSRQSAGEYRTVLTVKLLFKVT